MKDKNKIYDYACAVVNFEGVVKYRTLADWLDGGEYRIDDAVDEWVATDEGRAFMRDWAKNKLSGNIILQYKERLITHTVKVLTKLFNDNYIMEVK